MSSTSLQLDERLLQAIADLSLTARALVEGFLQGQHRSSQLGSSQEFVAYRPYLPGDPLKAIDWNVWGRSDHYFVRQFRHETNFRGQLVVDASRSMDHGEGNRSKIDYARLLAACLATLMAGQMDAPGLTILGRDGGTLQLDPSTRRDEVDRLFLELSRLRADGRRADLGDLLPLTDSLRRRSLVVWISDGLVDPAQTRELLQQCRWHQADVLYFHLLHRDEVDPPWRGEILLEDSETGAEIVIDADDLRRHYRARLDAFLTAQEDLAHGLEVHYHRLVTDEPLDAALHQFLTLREQL